MKTVFVAENPAQAHLVAGLLEEQQIECFIEGEMLFGARGELGLTPSTAPTISVRDEDAPHAAELIAACERRLAESREAADPDAAPSPPVWRGVATIAALWCVIGAVGSRAIGVWALPIVAVCLFVHVWLHFDRAS